MHYLLIMKNRNQGSYAELHLRSIIQPTRFRVLVESPRDAAVYLYRSKEDNGERLNDEADLYAIDEEIMMVSRVLIPRIKFEP